MVENPTQTITVDRISKNGNPVAAETRDGKAIHVPGRYPGDRLEVELVDAGGYYRARVVDRFETARTPEPSGPTSSGTDPTLLELGEELCDEPLSMEQRHSESKMAPREYPGKEHRHTIATRHD